MYCGLYSECPLTLLYSKIYHLMCYKELLEIFTSICILTNDGVLLQTELLSSLVLSMLQQILSDDKGDGVRQAAAKSLAVLVAFINDKAKFQNVIILCIM